MPSIEINAEEVVDVEVLNTYEITTSTSTNVSTSNSAVTNVEPNEYYLTSGGIYTGSMIDGYPQWLADYVDTQLSTNTSLDNNSIITTLQERLDSAELGIGQNLTSINTVNSSINILETSIVSRLDDSEAGIIDLYATRVTESGATALYEQLISASFDGNVEAYKASVSTAIANAATAYVSDYDLLVATYNDVSASVTEYSEALVSRHENPEWVDDGSQTDPDIYGEPRWIYEARAKNSLMLDANGAIVGHVYETDGSKGEITFLTNVFNITDGSNVANIPFSIITGTPNRVQFNGVVSFSNTNMDPYDNSDVYINSSGYLMNAGGGQAEVPSGAQAKADAAEDNANSYTDAQVVTLNGKYPKVITSSSAPTSSNIEPINTLWRHSKTVSIGGVLSTEYDHYVSEGSGTWRAIGGTYIDGSHIITGSVNAHVVDADIINALKVYINDNNPAAETGKLFTVKSGNNQYTAWIESSYTGSNANALHVQMNSGASSSSNALHVFNNGAGNAVTATANGAGIGGTFLSDSGYGIYTASTYYRGAYIYSGYNHYGAYIESLANSGIYCAGTTYGLVTPDAIQAVGGVNPFTGSHPVFTIESPEIGDIIIVTNAEVSDINNSDMYGEVSTISMDKRAIGVCSRVDEDIQKYADTDPRFNKYEHIPEMKIDRYVKHPGRDRAAKNLVNNNYKITYVNAVGEGGINVCGENGDIEIGDYIITSSILGKGMKQDDDLMHNYTVAKALENVHFTHPNEVKQIACTYHCG